MPKARAKPKPRSIQDLGLGDRDELGKTWQTEADRLFSEEYGGDVARWSERPHPLPDFAALRPAHVTREVFGAFLLDRDLEVLHSVADSAPECELDAIANATFVHFGHEVADVAPEATPCSRCFPTT